MNSLLSLTAVFGMALIGIQSAVSADTWYLYTTTTSGGAKSLGSRPVILEMDTKQGCEIAGNKLKADVSSNKLEHIRVLSFTCVKRQ